MDSCLSQITRSYLLRAEELRAIAETDCSAERYAALLKIADEYDLMAKTADAIERTYQRLRLN